MTADTEVVVTGNVADVDPAGIVKVVGIVATVLLLLAIATVTLLVGAGKSVTVPVDEAPPITEVGFNDRLIELDDGFTVRTAVA